MAMVLLVTSALGANGAGYGKLLAFNKGGELLGPFSADDRIVDPRGVGVKGALLFLNSGSNRILALDSKGRVVGDSGAIVGLNPAGGNFGPDGHYYVGSRAARTIIAFAPTLDRPGELVLPSAVVPFPRGFAFGHDCTLYLASGIGPGNGRQHHFWRSAPNGSSTPPGRSKTRNSVRSISQSHRTATWS
jgi:hypothetical protein